MPVSNSFNTVVKYHLYRRTKKSERFDNDVSVDVKKMRKMVPFHMNDHTFTRNSLI